MLACTARAGGSYVPWCAPWLSRWSFKCLQVLTWRVHLGRNLCNTWRQPTWPWCSSRLPSSNPATPTLLFLHSTGSCPCSWARSATPPLPTPLVRRPARGWIGTLWASGEGRGWDGRGGQKEEWSRDCFDGRQTQVLVRLGAEDTERDLPPSALVRCWSALEALRHRKKVLAHLGPWAPRRRLFSLVKSASLEGAPRNASARVGVVEEEEKGGRGGRAGAEAEEEGLRTLADGGAALVDGAVELEWLAARRAQAHDQVVAMTGFDPATLASHLPSADGEGAGVAPRVLAGDREREREKGARARACVR